MTEAEWLASDDPWAVLEFIRPLSETRRTDLLACIWGRHLMPHLSAANRALVERIEAHADDPSIDDPGEDELIKVLEAIENDGPDSLLGLASVVYSLWVETWEEALGDLDDPGQIPRDLRLVLVAELRDIFGNPFRPFVLPPACRTPSVLALARAAYDERTLPTGHLDADRLAVLADALEDAGVTGDILAHLRSSGPHVRGCWALDVVLGRA